MAPNIKKAVGRRSKRIRIKIAILNLRLNINELLAITKFSNIYFCKKTDTIQNQCKFQTAYLIRHPKNNKGWQLLQHFFYYNSFSQHLYNIYQLYLLT